jgi:hypothetical protein
MTRQTEFKQQIHPEPGSRLKVIQTFLLSVKQLVSNIKCYFLNGALFPQILYSNRTLDLQLLVE